MTMLQTAHGEFYARLERVKTWQFGRLYLRMEFCSSGSHAMGGWRYFRFPLVEVGISER